MAMLPPTPKLVNPDLLAVLLAVSMTRREGLDRKNPVLVLALFLLKRYKECKGLFQHQSRMVTTRTYRWVLLHRRMDRLSFQAEV